jgi:hypothetical protein
VLRESGFTHLLLAETVGPDGRTSGSLLHRLAQSQWTSKDQQRLLSLCRYDFPEPDGTLRRYWLLMLLDR